MGKTPVLVVVVDPRAAQQRIPDSEYANLSLLVVPKLDAGIIRGASIGGFFAEQAVDDRLFKAITTAKSVPVNCGLPVVIENGQ